MIAGQILGGKYKLERLIGHGGMGSVWLAFDVLLQRPVAVKLMSADNLTSTQLRAQFEREAMTSAQLVHPNVVQVYDYGVYATSPFIIMEYLEGEDLSSRLHRQTRLPTESVLQIVSQIAKALKAAHAAGIVHRDLKPSNIFLARTDAEEVVKLLDFGVSVLATGLRSDQGEMKSRFGGVIGTPKYMSPEQMCDIRMCDARSDLWSLAVMMYRSLTGKLPFTAESPGELIVRICVDEPQRPSALVPELGTELDAFFRRALAKAPAARFQSVDELLEAFVAASKREPPRRTTKVLYVDDESDATVLIKHRLRKQVRDGLYEILFAENGVEAIEHLRRFPDIDVVITDINMPQMDGLTLLQHVSEINSAAKVIIVSAYGDMSNVRAAMNRGAADFLVKPIDFKDFEATLEKTASYVHEVRRTLKASEENSALRMFMHNGMLDRLLPAMRIGGESVSEVVDATVAFIDVWGVDQAVASSPPASVIHHVNRHLEVVIGEVISHGGSVDNFIGGAVLAVFRESGHHESAVAACVAIRDRLQAMRSGVAASAVDGYDVVIGVAAGGVIVGSVGARSSFQMGYTTFGAAVEAAVQLRSVAARNQILVTEPLYEATRGSFVCESLGPIPVPGREASITAYQVASSLLAEGPASLGPESLPAPSASAAQLDFAR